HGGCPPHAPSGGAHLPVSPGDALAAPLARPAAPPLGLSLLQSLRLAVLPPSLGTRELVERSRGRAALHGRGLRRARLARPDGRLVDRTVSPPRPTRRRASLPTPGSARRCSPAARSHPPGASPESGARRRR